MQDDKGIQLISPINQQSKEESQRKTITFPRTAENVSRIISMIPIPRDSKKFPQIKIILVLVAIQRLALYTLLNFQLNLDNVGFISHRCNLSKWNGEHDSILTFACSFLFAPIAGLLADWKFGRHRVLSFGLAMSFLGYSLLGFLFSLQLFSNDAICGAFFFFYYLSILIIVIGSSSFNAVIIPYGVDQMKEASVITTLPSYFHWYFFFINLGALLAGAGGVYHYSDNVNARLEILGYVFGAILLSFLSVLLFKISSMLGWLLPSPPQGNPLEKIIGVTKNAISIRISKRNTFDIYHKTKPLMDYAKSSLGGSYTFEQVEDVKTFFSMVLVLLSLALYFSEEYLSVNYYILQGYGFLNSYASIAPILISKVGIIASLITIVVLEFTILGRKFYRFLPRILHRFTLGFPLAIISILIAAILEYAQKTPCIFQDLHHNVSNSPPHPPMSKANDSFVYLQIFQYIVISISEVFVTVGSIEWVYAQSPEYLRAFTYGIFESVIGLGTFMPFIFNILIYKITCRDIDNGDGCAACWVYEPSCVRNGYCYSAYYFFTTILLMSIVAIIIFLLISFWYKPRMRQKLRGFQNFSSTTRPTVC